MFRKKPKADELEKLLIDAKGKNWGKFDRNKLKELSINAYQKGDYKSLSSLYKIRRTGEEYTEEIGHIGEILARRTTKNKKDALPKEGSGKAFYEKIKKTAKEVRAVDKVIAPKQRNFLVDYYNPRSKRGKARLEKEYDALPKEKPKDKKVKVKKGKKINVKK